MPHINFKGRTVTDKPGKYNEDAEIRVLQSDRDEAAIRIAAIEADIVKRRKTARTKGDTYSVQVGKLDTENKPAPARVGSYSKENPFRPLVRTVTEGVLYLVQMHFEGRFPHATAFIDDCQQYVTPGKKSHHDGAVRNVTTVENEHGATLVLAGIFASPDVGLSDSAPRLAASAAA